MQSLTKHIILIGFKHTGKSSVGKYLAKKLNTPFIDLDQKIELVNENKFQIKMTSRQIMQDKGEEFFRQLEVDCLNEVIHSQPCVLSVGGGTPLSAETQKLLQPFIIIHITASRKIVYERICLSGIPAFFNPAEDLLESFNKLWVERNKIYNKIKKFTINNNHSIEDSVDKIIQKLKLV